MAVIVGDTDMKTDERLKLNAFISRPRSNYVYVLINVSHLIMSSVFAL